MALTDETVDEKTEEMSFYEEDTTIPEDPKKKKRRKKLITLGIICGVIFVLILSSGISGCVRRSAAKKNMYKDVKVERRTVKTSITGSSSVEPNDSYKVTTMKSGDITADYFKEGDTVKKGDKLYQFDDEDARSSLKTAQNALTKAESGYVDAIKQKAQTINSNNIATKTSQNAIQKALNSLSDSRRNFDDQYVKAGISGKVASVSVRTGETINAGTPIAQIYSDTYMKLRVPFNDYDAQNVNVGDGAEITVTGSGDVLWGSVTEKSTAAAATASHTMVVYVTVETTNPATLTENDRGSVVVNGAACADSANFEYIHTEKITAKTSGTLKTLNIAVGDSVYAGEQVAYIEFTSAPTALSNAQLSYNEAVLALERQVLQNDTYAQDSAVRNAQLALDDAKTNLKKAEDAVKDYVVEAPIEGTVVKKNAKSGDVRDSGNSNEELCVIYDLSSLKIKIDVDETEIALVKTGQRATVTADAAEGVFEGEVTKVPVDGVNENGVTTYTIEICIKEYGDLLPGMNVDAEIVVEEAANVLAVPLNSVNRGDIVFVKDDGKKRDNDITDEIKSRSKDGADKNKDKKSEMPRETMPVVSGEGIQPVGKGQGDLSNVPMNTEIPEGYRAIRVETGINDTEYIEIKSGLSEDDTVRTLNTETNSRGASFGSDDMMAQMEQRGRQQMQQGPPGGGMGGMGGGPR